MVGLLLLCAAATQRDWLRAKTKIPRAQYKGDTQTELSKVLNSHLLKTEASTRDCGSWNHTDLQDFMSVVLSKRDSSMDDLYQEREDRRKLLHGDLAGHRSHWEQTNGVLDGAAHLHKPLRDSHCRQ